jgi:hypothetical protein
MEKPKNYYFRVYVANVSALPLVLSILFMKHNESFVLPGFFLIPITFFASILSIMQGIRFKDRKYILLGILPFLILFISIWIRNSILGGF